MTTTRTRTIDQTVALLVLGLLGAAAAALAGCGSAPSCEQVVKHVAELRDLGSSEATIALARCEREDWPDALRSCAAKAKSADDLERCTAQRRPEPDEGAFGSYMKKGKQSEAELNLMSIEKALKRSYAEHAAYPVGEAGPTPAAGSCCEGPGKKCAPDPSLWNGVAVWDELDFEVTEPAYFSYAYRAEIYDRAVVEAIGDLDCDSITATYTLVCDVDHGSPRCELSRPAHAD